MDLTLDHLLIIFFGLFIVLSVIFAVLEFKRGSAQKKVQRLLKSHYDRCFELNRKIEDLLTRESKVEVVETGSKDEFEQKLEQLKKRSNNPHVDDRYNNVYNLKTQFDFNKQNTGKYLCFVEYDLSVLKTGVTKHDYNKLAEEYNETAKKYNELKSKDQPPISLIVYI